MLLLLRKKIKFISSELFFLIYFHLSLLFLFLLFRLIFIYYFYDELIVSNFFIYLKAVWLGIRLDLIVTSYLSLPILFTIFNPFRKWNSKLYVKLFYIYFYIILLLLTFFSFINIEWYKEFGTHLNTMLMMYGTTQEAWGLVFEQYNLLLYIFLSISIIVGIYSFFKYLQNSIFIIGTDNKIKFFTFILSILLTGVLIRGGLQNRPLDWGYAYFSKSNLANSIAQNPIFFFGRSFIEMKAEEDYKNNFLKITNINEVDSIYKSLKEKNSINDNFLNINKINGKSPNIVLIILESFISENCNFLNPRLKESITPFLSKLSSRSISFSNCFANGVRSAYGIGSILGSWPVIPGKPIISQVESGFSNNVISKAMDVFKELGYNRTFIYGGDANFDNMKGFCMANGFDSIIDDKDRLFNSKDGTPFGIFDHLMIDTLIKIANSKDKNSPFMLTLFTTTNHTPFRIPKEYESYFQNIKTGKKNYLKAKKTMAYNDLIIKEFFEKIKYEEWYKNTIFVITADHGLNIHRDLQNHPRNGHIPFIIYSELIDTPILIEKIVSQVDIMPTIIDLIGKDQHLLNFYGISGLKNGPGFACRIESDHLQWITPNNIYNQMMGQNQSSLLKFNNIWDLDYKESDSNEISRFMIESNAYIKNAYHQFKSNNY
jgi:phosphoglycerol transferase MdoB-like AlkP superfamily enzyme